MSGLPPALRICMDESEFDGRSNTYHGFSRTVKRSISICSDNSHWLPIVNLPKMFCLFSHLWPRDQMFPFARQLFNLSSKQDIVNSGTQFPTTAPRSLLAIRNLHYSSNREIDLLKRFRLIYYFGLRANHRFQKEQRWSEEAGDKNKESKMISLVLTSSRSWKPASFGEVRWSSNMFIWTCTVLWCPMTPPESVIA